MDHTPLIPCNLTMDALMRCLLSSKFCWTCSTCRPFTHSVLWQSAPWLWSSYNPNRDQRLKAWHKVGVKGRYSFQGHSKTSKRPLAVIGVFGWFWTYSICFNAFQPFSTLFNPFNPFHVSWLDDAYWRMCWHLYGLNLQFCNHNSLFMSVFWILMCFCSPFLVYPCDICLRTDPVINDA